jgi:hypothetical protein
MAAPFAGLASFTDVLARHAAASDNKEVFGPMCPSERWISHPIAQCAAANMRCFSPFERYVDEFDVSRSILNALLNEVIAEETLKETLDLAH